MLPFYFHWTQILSGYQFSFSWYPLLCCDFQWLFPPFFLNFFFGSHLYLLVLSLLSIFFVFIYCNVFLYKSLLFSFLMYSNWFFWLLCNFCFWSYLLFYYSCNSNYFFFCFITLAILNFLILSSVLITFCNFKLLILSFVFITLCNSTSDFFFCFITLCNSNFRF